jgi:hypothetical protein
VRWTRSYAAPFRVLFRFRTAPAGRVRILAESARLWRSTGAEPLFFVWKYGPCSMALGVRPPAIRAQEAKVSKTPCHAATLARRDLKMRQAQGLQPKVIAAQKGGRTFSKPCSCPVADQPPFRLSIAKPGPLSVNPAVGRRQVAASGSVNFTSPGQDLAAARARRSRLHRAAHPCAARISPAR